MTGHTHFQPRADLVRRLRSSEPLPACPFDRISPLYLTMPDDKPCPFCGQENTLDGPDKCRGADTRIMGEAADRIEKLEAFVRYVLEMDPDNKAPLFAKARAALEAKPAGGTEDVSYWSGTGRAGNGSDI